jgi:hypothetical protein
MSSAPHDEGDAWRRVVVVAELARLHQLLLAQVEQARKALEPPHYVWTVENSEVNGYLAQVGGTELPESERTALLARLHDDVTALQRLADRIEQLRAMTTEPEGRKEPEGL